MHSGIEWTVQLTLPIVDLWPQGTELLEDLEDVKVDVAGEHEWLQDVDVLVHLLVVLQTTQMYTLSMYATVSIVNKHIKQCMWNKVLKLATNKIWSFTL